jgi:hypothetical protein
MGLFDFLKKGSNPPPAKGTPPLSKKVAGPAKLVSDKRAQAYDRAEAIRQLAELETAEAAEALLKRFTFTIDPSITDQEEKEAAYEGVVRVGEAAVPAVLAFCRRAEVLTWPLRMLRAILSDEAYKTELLGLAESFDTEYSRNVEPKLQVVAALEEVAGEDVRVAVERFLDDVNETVRFHAVQSTFAQAQKQSADALVRLLESEESVRIKNKICEGFILKEWAVPTELLEQAKKAMSDVSDFRLRDDGKFSRR